MALDGLRPEALAVEMSTLTPDRARKLAAAVVQRGGRLVDAPVVGARPHAEAGTLAVLAGGDADAAGLPRHVLEATARAFAEAAGLGALDVAGIARLYASAD